MRLILTAIFILISSPSKCFSECWDCSSSMGVEVELKSGERIQGYIEWNNTQYDVFFSPDIMKSETYASLNEYVTKRGWWSDDRWKIGSDEAFNRWAELINFCASNGLAIPNQFRVGWKLYPRLLKVTFPREKYLGVKGEEKSFLTTEIKKIKRSQTLLLRVPTTGLDAVSLNEIKELNSKPKYQIEQEFGVGASVYAVYSDSAPIVGFIGSLINEGPEKIILDGNEIALPRFGDYDFKCPDTLGESLSVCEQVKVAWGKYYTEREEKETPCMNERNALAAKLKSEGEKDAYNNPVVKSKTQKCVKVLQEILEKYGFAPLSEDQMRRYGIVKFSYSWD